MSSARSNASAIQKRTQSAQFTKDGSSELKFPRQEEQQKKLTPIQAIIQLSESVQEMKLQLNNSPSSNDNEDKIINLEKGIENLNKTISSQILKTNDENKLLKDKIQNLEKTVSDLQSLVNTLSTKILSTKD
jgi:hypothetical protein